jgi:hypothetical protein
MSERPTNAVTIELWDVFQAWTGLKVQQWEIVHNGTPLLGFDTREEAEAQVRDWGWEIKEDDGDKGE